MADSYFLKWHVCEHLLVSTFRLNILLILSEKHEIIPGLNAGILSAIKNENFSFYRIKFGVRELTSMSANARLISVLRGFTSAGQY